MKILGSFFILSILLLTLDSKAQEEGPVYPMQTYIMVFLEAGDNRDQSEEEAMQIQEEHLEHLRVLTEKGILVMAGPFLDDSDIRGIAVYNVETVKEARIWAEQDPAVIAGRLKMTYRPWYGPAHLIKLSEESNK